MIFIYFTEYLKNKEMVMHLEHKVGEAIMIDFAGKKFSYADTSTGEIISCQVLSPSFPSVG